MTGCRITQQRQCAVLITWPECSQQGIILTQPGLFIPRHTVLRAVLQTGQGFLQFRQGMQPLLQRLI
ncbi:hypothetical protein D3C81_1743690 [compost metagenome]